MVRHKQLKGLIGFAIIGVFLAPSAPAVAERKSPLDGQPAVRHRLLLVKKRLEIAPAFEAAVNADFKHTVSGGLKLEYHLSDMLSIGAVGFYGKSFNTGLTDRILSTLPRDADPSDPTPARFEFREHLNEIPIHGAAYIGVTPWYGKLAAFGGVFVNFDFYFQGGVSVAQLKNQCCSFNTDPFPEGNLESNPPVFPDNNPNNDDPLNDGTRVGLYLGGGIHVFLSNWLALDLTVRNYVFKDNPSGLDFDADLAVTKRDNRVLNHLFMGAGISLFFPTRPKRTE
jgi:outer membrane beta-barrel protein